MPIVQPPTVDHGRAWFAAGVPGDSGIVASRVVQRSTDVAVLDRGGWWAVLITFEGAVRLWRFADVRAGPLPDPAADWAAVPLDSWRSSLDEAAYVRGVHQIRGLIREGSVYQVNLCRVLSAPFAPSADPWALAVRLAAGNPAPYAAVLDLPARGRGRPATRVVSASPELFLRRDGDVLQTSPIKGTALTEADLLPKDEAENVMIVDLMRNDLHHIARPGTVEVTALLRRERHPGLVHLVSTVQGRLREGVGWGELLEATMPPGSVSGAPKSSALAAISALEPVPRGPYCGAIGWVDADTGQARLSVGIRTFWWEGAYLKFGTGAGITWESDPAREWSETELKARTLLGIAGASGSRGEGEPAERGDVSLRRLTSLRDLERRVR